MTTATIGASLTDHDCTFRVWAPHAERVRVLLQDASQWEATADARTADLERANDGYWSATVSDAVAGTLYRFEITHAGQTFERLDPAARDVLNSALTRNAPEIGNASIVTTHEPYAWSRFVTPRFENFIIYQLHVGSFAGRNDHFRKSIATFADVESKLEYLRELGFNAIEFLPVQEFAMDRSWGYNPAAFFALESAYGSPKDLKRLVDRAHRSGLAIIFDVVYNHAGPEDNLLWEYDGYSRDGGIYFEDGRETHWGPGPAWHKREVQDFFLHNARMYFADYNADGLRFDVTTQIDGRFLKEVMWRLHNEYPEKYMIAEHLPSDRWITTHGNFDATWFARAHHEVQRALAGSEPVRRVKSVLGWDGFDHSWNLVKYTMGSHDDIGDANDGNAENGLRHWDPRHRYLIDQFGGRDNWHARAKCRLAWALNVTMPGTPMMFMGSECHMGAPGVAWGYWHDGADRNGDHRFDWSLAGDVRGMDMRRLVSAANRVRWKHPALRNDSLTITHEDETNHVIAFRREAGGDVVLVVVNLSERNFGGRSYGVATGGHGRWSQILCTQDAAFGGWDGAGNSYYEPWTRGDGRIYINLPKWSVSVFRRR